MLVVMQLKMTPEMADKIRLKLEHLRTLTSDEKLLKKLNYNNILRAYIQIGISTESYNELETTDQDLLSAIDECGMTRGRPTQDG